MWNGMEFREFARKIPNKSFLYIASFTSIISHESEQEFFVFCGMSEANEAKYKKQKTKNNIFTIIITSINGEFYPFWS